MEIPYDVIGDILSAAEERRKNFPVHSMWSSKIGHPCERYLELHQTAWEQIIPPSATTQLLFEGGNVIERYIAKPWLERAGYEVYPGESFKWERFNISGRLDFKIRKDRGPKIPIEVKGLNHWDFEKLNCIEDFLQSKKYYIRGYPAQLAVYMLKENAELGLFLIVSKLTWAFKVIWIDLDYTFAEDLLKRAERVHQKITKIKSANPANDEELRKMLSDPIDWADDICGRCDLLHVCQPGKSFGEGAEVLDMPELEEKLDRRKGLYPGHKEYEAIDKEIKKVLKGSDKLIIGKWLVTGKWIDKDAFSVGATKYWQAKFIPVGKTELSAKPK